MKTSISLVALVPAVLLGAVGAALAADTAAPPAGPGAQRSVDKASPILMMTGRVTQVDANAKTFTLVAKGKQHTFVVNNFKALPKVGDVVDVAYTGTTGGAMQATTVKSSKSNSQD
jgi:hypothetical protein